MAVGFDRTLIETIAQEAGVSTVTVHNYFGTKSGLLLAIVAEEDSRFLTMMRALLDQTFGSLPHLAEAFARDLFLTIDRGLGRQTWRQIISSAIRETNSASTSAYRALDAKLIDLLAHGVERLRGAGQIDAGHDSRTIADAVFRSIRDRTISFACNEDWSVDHAAGLVARDVGALIGVRSQRAA
jgi:AcrR family transcriptional regulator